MSHTAHKQYQTWMTLLFPVLSFKLLQRMDQQIFWPLHADSTFSQFVHLVISCDYIIIFVYSMVVWMICHFILFRVLIKRVSGFTVLEVCAYETMLSMVLLWQWDFQGSVMPCSSKALETYPCSDSQKYPWQLVSVCTSNCSPPGMILPLALLSKYWIERVTIGLLYVKYIVSIRKLYKGVPGLATDCLCGVGCC